MKAQSLKKETLKKGHQETDEKTKKHNSDQ